VPGGPTLAWPGIMTRPPIMHDCKPHRAISFDNALRAFPDEVSFRFGGLAISRRVSYILVQRSPQNPLILVGSEAIALWRSASSFVMHRFYLAVTIVGIATLVVASLIALERMIG
jgi:hypothetical protein